MRTSATDVNGWEEVIGSQEFQLLPSRRNVVPQRQRQHLAWVCAQRWEGNRVTRSTLWDSRGTLRRWRYRSEDLASWSLLANHPKGRPSILPRVRPMTASGSTYERAQMPHQPIRAIPKMGPRLRWPIYPRCGMHGQQVYFGRNRILHQMGRSERVTRQHGGIHRKCFICDDLCRGSLVMAIKITKGCGFVDHYGCNGSQKRTYLDERFSKWTRNEARRILTSLW